MTEEAKEQEASTVSGGQNERLVMCDFLRLFDKNDDWFLPRNCRPDEATMAVAQSQGYVKQWGGPKGSTFIIAYSLTPSGRLFIKQNT